MNTDKRPDDPTARECRKIFEQIDQCPPSDMLIAFQEEELDAAEATTVAAHLGGCPVCARLLEQLEMADGPVPADETFREAREEDRRLVAKALGFRVERPQAIPLLDRLSQLWQTRVPAPVPVALCALLLMVLVWPAGPESPVTVFGPVVPVTSSDISLRGSTGKSPDASAPADALLDIRHIFTQTPVAPGTIVNREITGPQGTEHLAPRIVSSELQNGHEKPCIHFPLQISEPGTYLLRLSHPEDAFDPVTLKIEILAP